MTGIYYIKNTISNTYYIGKSKNIERRFARHKSELKHNNHKNLHLQRSYNKYGLNVFEFGIIEICNESNLNDREIYYIEKYRVEKKQLYNITSGGDGGVMPQYIVEQNKIKISKANKGNKKVANFGKANGMFGKHHTAKSKHLMSIHSHNKGKDNPMYGKRGKDNPNYGRKCSNEQKQKMSISMLGKNMGNRKYTQDFIDKLREEYKSGKSYAEIGRKYNKSYNTISCLVRFGLPAYPYKYKNREDYE